MKLNRYNLINSNSNKVVSRNHKLTEYEAGKKNEGYATNQVSLRYQKQGGFTLVEFLIVMAIVSIIGALFVSALCSQTQTVRVIDGCEYIQTYAGHGGYNLTHKGNCTNEIHKLRQ